MNIIQYRVAELEDALNIALLHARSWQRYYRGIWDDAFLDGPVLENRKQTWTKRLSKPADNQFIMLAESSDELVGFVCMYADEDAQYGALLDNLHVSSTLQGQGIGKALMQQAAAWLYERNPRAIFYLWVLKGNEAAQQFYNHLGGENKELVSIQNPDGNFNDCYRYVWRDLKAFLKN